MDSNQDQSLYPVVYIEIQKIILITLIQNKYSKAMLSFFFFFNMFSTGILEVLVDAGVHSEYIHVIK
jgi:hypothetical protein